MLGVTGAWGDAWEDCEAEEDLDSRIRGCTSVIELDPKRVKAYFNRGRAYYNKHVFDRAIADFTKTIELRPNNAADYINRGAAHAAKGDKEQAIADFRKALEINPSAQGAKEGLKMLDVTP